MKVGRTVLGVLGILLGAAAIAGSLSVLVDDRDADDFFVSEEQHFVVSSFAVASEDVDVLTSAPGWLTDRLTDPVDVRIQGARTDGGEVFFGIGEYRDVEAYLAGVSWSEVTSLDFKGDDIRYDTHAGALSPSAPSSETFWVASAAGPGEQTLDWSVETGNWSAVLMNADASEGIDATVVFGGRVSNLVLVMWIGLALGILLLVGGAFLVYRGSRRQTSSQEPRPQQPREVPSSTTSGNA